MYPQRAAPTARKVSDGASHRRLRVCRETGTKTSRLDAESESCGRLDDRIRRWRRLDGFLGLPDQSAAMRQTVRLDRVLDGEVVAPAVAHAAGHLAASRSAQPALSAHARGNQL